MRERLKRALYFLRITDEQNNVSLTNLAIWIVLVRMVYHPELMMLDIGALLIAYMTYSTKKILACRKPPTAPESESLGAVKSDISHLFDQIKELRDKIGGISLAAGIKNRKQ